MGVLGYVLNILSIVSSCREVPILMFYSDLADAFPNGEYANYFRNDWITMLVKETKSNRDYSPRTVDTARWTREQVKRQISLAIG